MPTLPTLVTKSATLVALLFLFTTGFARAQRTQRSRELPARFVAHRIYVRPVTTEGDTVRLYTDTGGGLLLLEPAVKQLGLPILDTATVRGRSVPVAALPDFRPNTSIPPVPRGRLLVFPAGGHAKLLNTGDGMLGQSWFGGRIWTFDYPGRQLLLHPSAEGLSFDPAHTVRLGFKADSTGQRVNNFPSLEATIDGETYAFLFDTGATLLLTDSAHTVLGGPPLRGTSFIIQSLFEKWHAAHPDWRVIVDGGQFPGADLIEVPKVTIAGYTAGPVWFVTRPDANFHERMSSIMDRRVDGALGGSLFQYFVITVDYPGARAAFRRAE